MASELPYQPIIVIGAARSGTKLIRDLIALHPRVARVPYDVNFIWHYGNQKVRHDELSVDLATPKVREGIRRRLGKFSQSRQYLTEKTVGNCLRVPFVKAVFPEARFIHLLRDGTDVVESVLRQWTAPTDWPYLFRKALSFPLTDTFRYSLSYAGNLLRRSRSGRGTWGVRYQGIDADVEDLDLLEVCAKQWRYSVERALESLQGAPETLTLKYEELVADPHRHLDRIGEFVGLGPRAFDGRIGDETISTSNVGKGRRVWRPEQTAKLGERLDHLLTRLGYPPVAKNEVLMS